MKNDKMKWYFLIAAALIVGAMVGYFATNSLSTTGNAKQALLSNENEWLKVNSQLVELGQDPVDLENLIKADNGPNCACCNYDGDNAAWNCCMRCNRDQLTWARDRISDIVAAAGE